MVWSVAQIVVCGADEAEISRRAAAVGREVDELRTNGICGTPSEVVERLPEWAAIGVERSYLQILDLHDLDHLALIAEQVMPHVA